MKRTLALLPFICLALPSCDASDPADAERSDAATLSDRPATEIFESFGIDAAELPADDDAELEDLAFAIESDAMEPLELDANELARLDQLGEALMAVDPDAADALTQLSEIETELAALLGEEADMGRGPDQLVLDRAPVANYYHCANAAIQASVARLYASVTKTYSRLSYDRYGASYSSACWVYASLTHYYVYRGTTYAQASPNSWSARQNTIWDFSDALGLVDDAIFNCAVSLLQNGNTYANSAYTYAQLTQSQSQIVLTDANKCVPQ